MTGNATRASVRFDAVQKSFGNVKVLEEFNLEVQPGEFLVLLGASGSGKTTALRILSGLETPTAGQVYIADRDVTEVLPKYRDISMVFQSYALYPHMSVRKNIAFPLRMAGLSKSEQDARVAQAAEVLNLTDYLDRRPGQLSGGQRQRVAIGRAIVREPAAFLFDEPLSNLDAALRVGMRLEISELHKRLKTTMIYVTHDQVEAMTMADKIVVLRAGVIEQVGSPLELYQRPCNTFVAGFIGSPKMNLLGGDLAKPYGAHTIGIRPEHLDISTSKGTWSGKVGVSEHLGSDTFLHVQIEGHAEPITVRISGEMDVDYGATVHLTPNPDHIHRFDAKGLRQS